MTCPGTDMQAFEIGVQHCASCYRPTEVCDARPESCDAHSTYMVRMIARPVGCPNPECVDGVVAEKVGCDICERSVSMHHARALGWVAQKPRHAWPDLTRTVLNALDRESETLVEALSQYETRDEVARRYADASLPLRAWRDDFSRLIKAIRALPNEGEGLTVEQIGGAVGEPDLGLVVAALEEIAERPSRIGS